MIRFFILAMLCAGRLFAADAGEGVVDLDSQNQGSAPEGWSELEGQLGGPRALEALDAYLTKHPKGRAASRAQLERARRLENIEQEAEAYRTAYKEDPQGPWARLAALELGKQEYALGHSEAAMTWLDKVDDEALQGEPKAQLLFWRGQCRLVLKGFQKSQDDFEAFSRLFPDHALADSARLAVADCDAALKNDDAALTGYQKLYQAPASSVAPQAYLQAANLQSRAQRKDEARLLLQKLADSYPDSLEAGKAREILKSLPAAIATPVASQALKSAFTVQVGAYARRVIAEAIYKKLSKKGYPARLDKGVIRDNVLTFVQVGRYSARGQAQAMANQLKAKERLNTLIVEIKTP